MQAPLTEQTIQDCLNALAYADFRIRIKREFRNLKHTGEWEFVWAENQLRGAYFAWWQNHNALAVLLCLENARVICNERLSPDYLDRYNRAIAFLQESTSRAGTPVHDQGAHIKNLLYRMSSINKI
jgi:hypothetical protein